ncbi:O-antigen translocase [Seonamhaeicola sp. ML3]|uniref:O-antigen translocase n=1 Tax=Seonamhaeicola sp. ML3 TaxID=2937786 RepID=UPI00200F117C|nr:O-antigen translocase [Seonamhaeicola sp. ML3]
MDFKERFKQNLLLKITSLNAVVICIRLVISLVVQRILAVSVGEIGIAKIGQLRNLVQITTSTSSMGIFNGVVKYVAQWREEHDKLQKLFTTTFVFVFIGSILTSIIIFFLASNISILLFASSKYTLVIKILALLPPVIGVNRIFQAIINGLSEYKKFAKIDLISYIISALSLLVLLNFYGLKGVFYSIILTPIIQFFIIILVFGSTLKKFLERKHIKFKVPMAKELLAFTLMSFVSTGLLNYIELDIRTIITNKININEAGYWTAMNFISKNYMVFSSGLFTLYVIPKFARIGEEKFFFKEVVSIYKTILPLFGVGMLLVYLFRAQIVAVVYPNFHGLPQLFKWQLLGDFIRLASLVMAHQFLAKKMVKSFVFTELISLSLFYFLSIKFVGVYGTEGVVIAHFIRNLIILVIVSYLIKSYFRRSKN